MILEECEAFAEPGAVSYFEAATAAAFTAFARHPADFTILETGLGGRLDATNVVEKPLATLITRLSYDHREYLGDTLVQIAKEKAGIMRKGVPCFVSPQANEDGLDALRSAAAALHAPLISASESWQAEPNERGFHFKDDGRDFDLPLPSLPGRHQIDNAGLAIASLSVLTKAISRDDVAQGLKTAYWPARLQKLERGVLPALLPEGWELWLDGGHNDSAGEALAAQAEMWKSAGNKPLLLITGMLTTKRPKEFLEPLAPFIAAAATLFIPNEALSFAPEDLAQELHAAGISKVAPCESLQGAIAHMTCVSPRPARILICGSLYLAGHVLAENGAAIL